MRRGESVKPIEKLVEYEEEEERTLQLPLRRAAQQLAACAYMTRVTRSVPTIDPKLIALARGEREPARAADSDLPPTVPPPPTAPPSVIPLTEDDLIEVDEAWLSMSADRERYPTK